MLFLSGKMAENIVLELSIKLRWTDQISTSALLNPLLKFSKSEILISPIHS